MKSSIHSPNVGPGVTNNPVGGVVGGIVSNQLHAVVQHVDEGALVVGHNTYLHVLGIVHHKAQINQV